MTSVVEVADVRPEPQESRSVLNVWPALNLWSRLPMIWLILCLASVAGVAAFSPFIDRIGWIVALLLAALYGFLALSALMQRKILALSRATPISRRAVDWRLSEDGFAVSGAGLDSRVDWRLVVAAVEEHDRFIFALTPYSNFILPVRVLDAEQLTAVRGLIADARARGVLGAGVD